MFEAFLFIPRFSFQIQYDSERGDERTLNQESHTYSSTFTDTKTIQKKIPPKKRRAKVQENIKGEYNPNKRFNDPRKKKNY